MLLQDVLAQAFGIVFAVLAEMIGADVLPDHALQLAAHRNGRLPWRVEPGGKVSRQLAFLAVLEQRTLNDSS